MHHMIIHAQEGRHLQALLTYARSLGATRIVFPAREYQSKRAGETRRNIRAVSPGERTTRNIRRGIDEEATVRLPDREWVREVICGDGPVPSGLDPETIAAARRIARRLWGS